jgi:cytochrome c oxidase subunit 2
MKVDAVPGIETKYRITPNKLGDYPVVCAELCGLGHALMRQTAHVVTPQQFTAWVQKQKQPAQNAGGGGGSTGGGAVDAKAIFTQGAGAATACGACHTLSDAGTSASTGPNLDDGLKGRDAAFIKQSIEQPNAQIAQGYSPGIMPQNYRQTLSPEQIDALVKYLQQATGG